MQNRYVGDAGDFAKHGLLRRFSGLTDPETAEPDLRLGLVWYLFPDELHGADKTKVSRDGKQITYLDPDHKDAEMHRECDPDLWAKLRKYVDEGRRCVHCVQADPRTAAGHALPRRPALLLARHGQTIPADHARTLVHRSTPSHGRC